MRLTARRLRLGSGLVLLTYVTLHLLNHALGLWSIDLAEAGLTWAMRIWQSLPGTILLYGSAALHFSMALRTVYIRRSWRLPLIEWVRLWAGFSLPLLLIGHAVATRMGASFYGLEPSYHHVITNLIANEAQAWQLALLAPGWLHGCLGLWIGLRRYALARRLKPLLICVVVLVPALSALGFAEMHHAVATAPIVAVPPTPAAIARLAALEAWRRGILASYLAVIAAAVLAAQLRNRIEARRAVADR